MLSEQYKKRKNFVHKQEIIDRELLKIRVKPAKDPIDQAVNHPNKKIGMLLEAKAGDIIKYFKSDDKKGRSKN
jgi:hypothetical protein